MGSAPVPYVPEASTAPHSHSTVPPLTERAASPDAEDDNPIEADKMRREGAGPLGQRQSTASTATLPGSVRDANGGGEKGEERDLEKGEVEEDSRKAAEEGEAEDAVIVVDWDASQDGVDDPACPLNWPKRRRTICTVTVALYTLLAPLSSSMIAPAAPQVAAKLNITDEVLISMSVSIFVLAFAFSPLFFGPLSELCGRVRVLQGAGIFYAIFNFACAFAKTDGQFIAFRFLAGFGGGAPLSIGAGVLADMWRAEERGKASALYSLGPLLGPAMGPVMGGWIAEKVPGDGYRWIFFSTTIFSVLVQVLGIFYLRETYAPVLLRRKAAALKLSMGLPADSFRVQTIYEVKAGRKSTRDVVYHGMVRPFSLFFSEPILVLLAVYIAMIYGTIYILITTISSVFEKVYEQSVGIASLHFISLLIGFTVASQGGARMLDVLYRRLKAKEGGVGRAEFRLPIMAPASIILPLGLLLFGWCAEKKWHWIVADIGLFLIGLAMIAIMQSVTTYLIDAFTLWAASALAASTCLRSLCGFAFPLFAPYMFSGLGYGGGASVLAGAAILVGWTGVPFLYFFGQRIREHHETLRK